MGAVGTLLIEVALAAGAVLLALYWLTWLVGLAIVLRGSDPKDRVPLIREYAKCRPWTTLGHLPKPRREANNEPPGEKSEAKE
jgi:hypothetical protein